MSMEDRRRFAEARFSQFSADQLAEKLYALHDRSSVVVQNMLCASRGVQTYMHVQAKLTDNFYPFAVLDMAATLSWVYANMVTGNWPASSSSGYMGYLATATARELGRDL